MKSCLECIHCCEVGQDNTGDAKYKCFKKPVSNLPSFPFANTKCDKWFSADDIKIHKKQTVLGVFLAISDGLVEACYNTLVNDNKSVPESSASKPTLNEYSDVYGALSEEMTHYTDQLYGAYFEEFNKTGSKSQSRCFEKISRIVKAIIVNYSTNEAMLDKINRDYKLDKFYDKDEQETIEYNGKILTLQGEANIIDDDKNIAEFYYGDDGEVYINIVDK